MIAFLSYVREDLELVTKVAQCLSDRGVRVWLDRTDLCAGQRWKSEIRRAIREKAGVFIACFSTSYNEKRKSYMNEELTLAIEELRLRQPDQSWFIPVLLSPCEVPDREIGAGETLRDFQYISLFEDWHAGIDRLLLAVWPYYARVTEFGSHLSALPRQAAIELFGNANWAPLRELLQNAADAVRARRHIEHLDAAWEASTLNPDPTVAAISSKLQTTDAVCH